MLTIQQTHSYFLGGSNIKSEYAWYSKDPNSKLTALKPNTHNIETIAIKETDIYLSLRQETTDSVTAHKVLTLPHRHSPAQLKTNCENFCAVLPR